MQRYRSAIKGFIETGCLFALDVTSIILLFRISYVLRVDVLPEFYAGFPPTLPVGDPVKLWWVFLIWIFFFSYEGLYTRRFSHWDETRAIWRASFFSAVGIFTITSVGKLSGSISRTVIILMGAASMAALPLIRIYGKKALRRMGFLKRRVLILGAGETGRLIARALGKEPNYGYEVIGYLDDDPAKAGSVMEGVKVHRGVDRAERYLARGRITDLILAMPGAGKERLQTLMNTLQHKVDRVLLVPDVFGMAVMGTTLQHFFEEQAFALEVRNNLAEPVNYITKKCFDYVTGIILFLTLILPLSLISVIIRATSRGPALFRQERTGKKGKTFMCYKFRTMYRDAEERLRDILASDPEARAEWEQHWKLKDDPRITPVGRFLRKNSLDELPQLLNVLKGEMSLVGPRPVTKEEIDTYYGDMASLCFSVLPGITGLWQVSGRSNTSYDYRIALDSWYVRNWNLWLDIVILLKTISVVLKREGAH